MTLLNHILGFSILVNTGSLLLTSLILIFSSFCPFLFTIILFSLLFMSNLLPKLFFPFPIILLVLVFFSIPPPSPSPSPSLSRTPSTPPLLPLLLLLLLLFSYLFLLPFPSLPFLAPFRSPFCFFHSFFLRLYLFLSILELSSIPSFQLLPFFPSLYPSPLPASPSEFSLKGKTRRGEGRL